MRVMTYRYRCGQWVRFGRSSQLRNAADGAYQVTRQLPSDSDGERQYRIKSAREQYERVAKESELERA